MDNNRMTDLVNFILNEGVSIIDAPDTVILKRLDDRFMVDIVSSEDHPFFGMDFDGEFVCYASEDWKDYGRGAEFILNPELEYIKERVLQSPVGHLSYGDIESMRCYCNEIGSLLSEMEATLGNIKTIRNHFLEKLAQKKPADD